MGILRRDDFEDLLGDNFDIAADFKQYTDASYLEEAVAAENATESLNQSSIFTKIALPLKHTFEQKDVVVLVFLIVCFLTLLAVFIGAVYFGYREYSLLLRRVSLYEKNIKSSDEEKDGESKSNNQRSTHTGPASSHQVRGSAFSSSPYSASSNGHGVTRSSLVLSDNVRQPTSLAKTPHSWKHPLSKFSKREIDEDLYRSNRLSPGTQTSSPIDGGYMPSWGSVIDSRLSPIDIVQGSISPDGIKTTPPPETAAGLNYTEHGLNEYTFTNGNGLYGEIHAADNNNNQQNSPEPEEYREIKEPEIVYTMVQLYELEPLDMIQEFAEGKDNKLLSVDMLFPKLPINPDSSVVEYEKDLTMIRLNLLNSSLDTASKTIELIKLLTNSLGTQKFNNPRIFLMSYGILIEKLVESEYVTKPGNGIPTILIGAFIEVVVKYCVCCWKYSTSKHVKLDRKFAEWNMTPFVPSQFKIFKYIFTLIKSGHKIELLGEVLIFFSTPPTPHNLAYLFVESELAQYENPEVLELLTYLQKQINNEHLECCGTNSYLAGNSSPEYSDLETLLHSRVSRKSESFRRALPGAFAREQNGSPST
ncbi:hypothetical protein OGAPHI_001417 [Ogataea philodendri]|uniref:Uncharacterized protein n=1 Tax=Ogataea philodendri TaxID=1378263 RepID=A0A9P8PCJ2_9ASCO|nr:uncharacterized protein OGAPHI_001417 [Ogataea philodendri]KAH3669296.1 hypothetical protein OGAPHI_001417 [Ogataea philodendri]